MIGPRDTITLARTKIRSKRVRLLITTIVSALVFGVMAGVTVLFTGVNHSIKDFTRQNFVGQFLIQGIPNPINHSASGADIYDPAVIAAVQELNTAYLAERKAAAKTYGITDYDPRTEAPAVVEDNSPNVPAEFRKSVNTLSVAYQRYLAGKAKENSSATPTLDTFTGLVKPRGATHIYAPRSLAHLQFHLLAGGKEDLNQPAPATQTSSSGRSSDIAGGNYTIVDEALVAKFVVGANLARTPARGIPVLITADDALATFTTLNLPKRPADSGDQVGWFTDLRTKVNGQTFLTCYRNDAEQTRVSQARQQANEMAANKNNRDYVKPSLILALPTTPCGMVTVASDTRTAAERRAEENRQAFENQFTPAQAPLAEAVTFQVVGLLPSPSPNSTGVDAILTSMVGVDYGLGAIIPADSLKALPAELRHDALLSTAPTASPGGVPPEMDRRYLAAFDNVEAARRVVDTYSCYTWRPECESAPFQIMTYGSNYLAVDDIMTHARPVLLVLFGIAFGIATIIIWAMMGRVIADSRRETAVFRAIGAKRSDIVAVYLTYSLWVAVRIVVIAAVIAGGIAVLIEVLYAARATHVAQLAFAVFTPQPRFSFVGLTSPVLAVIFGGIVVMSLVAIAPPLLRNIRRNPIKDMRDE